MFFAFYYFVARLRDFLISLLYYVRKFQHKQRYRYYYYY